jgi:hypothetical protein
MNLINIVEYLKNLWWKTFFTFFVENFSFFLYNIKLLRVINNFNIVVDK